ncbi:hypothetical protein KUTeg_024979 [Tegillarca granosa]|uniref:Palmitoyltransferase n=1 Tax=Tegillarca granosa TaxID=220873 RepID=A0ABQ9DYV4_TEGGR|nr:hypothetical protein KUTeg_024979 [Tegillarca granosa]
MSGFSSMFGSSNSERKPSHQHEPGGECCKPDDSSSKDHPIFTAIKTGMLVPVQNIAEDGPEVFSMRDDKGHTPAHWACLGGHTTILRFIIENKGPVNEASNNELGARPIHWACVNGHIAIVDILLQSGVSFDVADNKGCTPLIVAAQYGHTMLAGYLMGKGSRLQMVDKDGDNALHWAAFKGFSELMRLLIYSGFNPRQRDNYGQTPLHLACINGNLTAVMELCEQDGVEVDLPDKNGKTPIMLATGRKHEDVVDYLKRQVKMKNSLLPKIDLLTIAFGPPGNSKAAILFFLINVVCWGYPMYVFKCLPYTWYDLQVAHIIFFIMNVFMWFCLYHASTTDPGFLPRNIPEYDQAIKQVAHFDEWKQGDNPLSRLCHTCRTVKPLRSKHCRVCNRCVKMFDHHCPYIYNCVGYRNRPWFFSFVFSMFILILLTDFFCYWLLSEFGWDWAVVIGAIEAAVGSVAVTAVTVLMTLHAAYNVTANERINWKRYNYLLDGKGDYYNPFNRGTLKNLQEFFLIIPSLTERDVEILHV